MKPKLVISPSVIDILFDSKIRDYLIQIDPTLQRVFDSVTRDAFHRLPKPPYVALIGAIIGQIVRYTQAKSIRSNLYRLCGTNFTSAIITGLKAEHWNYIGLSPDKVMIINRINQYLTESGNNLRSIDDIKQLKQIAGVGDWTINTTILTSFLDWDTFPSGDLFVRKRIKKLYNLSKVPTVREVRNMSERWSPYRSIVAWCLWRWFE